MDTKKPKRIYKPRGKKAKEILQEDQQSITSEKNSDEHYTNKLRIEIPTDDEPQYVEPEPVPEQHIEPVQPMKQEPVQPMKQEPVQPMKQEPVQQIKKSNDNNSNIMLLLFFAGIGVTSYLTYRKFFKI
jgi:hypothetical protein